MRDVMIDLETLGTQPGSVILSIGAVLFDPKPKGEGDLILGKEFYCVVGQPTCIAAGLTVDQSTLDWWEKQSEEARTVLAQSQDPAQSISLTKSLTQLAAFIPLGAKVWSNGANFDQPLLDVAYNKTGIVLPWKYWNSRCYRTIVAMHPNEKALRPVNACAHNALEDAKWQARHMVNIVKLLGLNL